jgi:hypothetical protein
LAASATALPSSSACVRRGESIDGNGGEVWKSNQDAGVIHDDTWYIYMMILEQKYV